MNGFRGRMLRGSDIPESYTHASGPVSIPPLALAEPLDADDVCRLVSWAATEGHPLIPRGAGTGMPGGNVGPGVIVDFASRMNGIGAVDPSTGRVRVEAGAIAADVERAANLAGFFLPPLPSSARWCTIGGMIAANAAGARTFGYGSIRESVEEIEAVMAGGRAVRHSRDGSRSDPLPPFDVELELDAEGRIREWPQIRKNSSGYALDHFTRSGSAIDLLIGGEGTLGCITAATLRLTPLPAARGVVLVRVADADGIGAVIRAATRGRASACEFFGRRFIELADLEENPDVREVATGAHALFLVEYDGPGDRVEVEIAKLEKLAASLGPTKGRGALAAFGEEERARLWQLRHAASPTIARAAEGGRFSMQFIEDSVVPVEHFPRYLEGVEEILAERSMDAVLFGHAGDGHPHVNPLVDIRRVDWRDDVREVLLRTAHLVAELGGTLSGEHGDGRIRAPLLPVIWRAEHVTAFRAIKESLDREGIFNPGVILPVPGQDPLEGLGTRFTLP